METAMASSNDIARRPHGRRGVVVQLLDEIRPTSVLDYGCGSGSLIGWLQENWHVEAHACDIDPTVVAQLRQRFGPAVTGHLVDDRHPRLPLGDGTLATVTISDVLEHIPADSRPAVLGEVHRVLEPQGALVVTVPHRGLLHWADPENVKFRFPRLHRAVYRRFKGAERFERLYGANGSYGNFSTGACEHKHFTVWELRSELSASGFQVTRVHHFRLLTPIIRTLLWAAEGLRDQIGMPRPVMRALWKTYAWDSEFQAGRLSDSVGILARKRGNEE
jgi:SAM-dependent methyltransferase